MKKVNHINQKKENNQLKEENPHYEIFQNDSFGNSNSQYYNYKNDNNNLNIINRNNIFINDIDTKLEITLNYLDLNELNDIFITNNISFKDMLILSKNDMIDLGFNMVQRNRLLRFSQDYLKVAVDFNIDEIHTFFQKNKNLNIKTIDNYINSDHYPLRKVKKNIRNNFSLSPKSKNIYQNEVFIPKKNTNNLILKKVIPNSNINVNTNNESILKNNIIKEYKRINSPKKINKHSYKISSEIFKNYNKIQKEIGNYLDNYNKLKRNNEVFIPNKYKNIVNNNEKVFNMSNMQYNNYNKEIPFQESNESKSSKKLNYNIPNQKKGYKNISRKNKSLDLEQVKKLSELNKRKEELEKNLIVNENKINEKKKMLKLLSNDFSRKEKSNQ